MKKAYLSLALALLTITIVMPGCLNQTEDEDVLFQTSMLSALSAGDYDGDITYGEVEQHGDFGLGTFDNLDGEMVALKGEFYQIKADGKAYPVESSMETPFSVVTFFEPDQVAPLNEVSDYEQLKQHLDNVLPSDDIFYAIKIEGVFEYIKARSVPAQIKPYPSLDEALEGQTIFEFHDVPGTLVGFWCPDYVDGLNAPGYHFHFITGDRKAGGHLLECKFKSAQAEIDYTSDFYMALSD